MLQLQPNTPGYQTVSLTVNERLKNWPLKADTLGVIFVLTDQMTQKEYKVICPNSIITATDRYWNISINTDGADSNINGGVAILNGGYFTYLCYAVNKLNINLDLADPNFSHFVERGLLLVGEAQDYFTEYDQTIPNSVAYNG